MNLKNQISEIPMLLFSRFIPIGCHDKTLKIQKNMAFPLILPIHIGSKIFFNSRSSKSTQVFAAYLAKILKPHKNDLFERTKSLILRHNLASTLAAPCNA